jgi:predicted dehydrogenase
VVDPDAARAAHVASRFQIPHQFADVTALLQANLADVVGVLTPPSGHASVAMAALEWGCHVLVEKPLALSLDEADALAVREQASAARCVMGFHMRWHRLIERARAALQSGAIGRPESIRAVWSSPRGDAGTPEWKRTRTTGGGAVIELGVHIFDLWRFLTGTEVSEVSAFTRQGARDDESAVITATLDNGMLASASLSERSSHDLEIQVSGDRGRVRVGCQQFDGFELYALNETNGMLGPRMRQLLSSLRELPGGLTRMRRLGDYGDSYRRQWEHVAAVARGATPACTLADGRAALGIALAAVASSHRREPVRVELAPREITPERPRLG